MGEQAVIEREGAERTINVERENITFGGGASSFNELTDRPKYADEEMTSETNIPSVSAETTARQEADNNLQQQIDAIAASSDVTDIVGTYATLQAYDTSKLKDNDIIKVLQDETHDDETTYYRWSISTETFTLIGEEGPYYTKSATDTLLAGKQNKLTAGANITIDTNNEISATDTTYSNFTGTDGTADGTAGLVPAPVVTDAGKFLKADGTWDNVSGGIPTTATFWGASYDNANNRVDGSILVGSAAGVKIASAPGSSTIYGTITGGSSYRLYVQQGASSGHLYLGRSSEIDISNKVVTINSSAKLTNIQTPTNATDAANKQYVDNAVAGAGATVLTNTQYNNLWSNA